MYTESLKSRKRHYDYKIYKLLHNFTKKYGKKLQLTRFLDTRGYKQTIEIKSLS